MNSLASPVIWTSQDFHVPVPFLSLWMGFMPREKKMRKLLLDF